MHAGKKIGVGSTVSIHFTLSLEDGTVAETSRDGTPLQFVVGDGTLLPGLESTLYGLKVGDAQCLLIEPEDAYGAHDPENIHILSRNEFPDDLTLEPGVIIGFTFPSGEEIPGTILETAESAVTVDFNHPLAGHDLSFDVEIISVD